MGFVSELKDRGLGLIGRGAPVGRSNGLAAAEAAHFDFNTDLSGTSSRRSDEALPLAELSQRIEAADHDRLHDAFGLAVRGKDSDGAFRVRGDGRWIVLSFGSLRDDNGALCGVTVSGRAVAPRQPMPPQGAIDPVSGLAFHAAALGRLERCWQEAQLHRAPISVLAIEIDDFSGMQQRSGRPAAARAIALCGSVAARTAGPGGLALRYGHATFALVLPNCSVTVSKAMAMRFAAETMERAEESVRASAFGVSVGGATVDALTGRLPETMQAALAALATAQNRRRGRMAFLDLRRAADFAGDSAAA